MFSFALQKRFNSAHFGPVESGDDDDEDGNDGIKGEKDEDG